MSERIETLMAEYQRRLNDTYGASVVVTSDQWKSDINRLLAELAEANNALAAKEAEVIDLQRQMAVDEHAYETLEAEVERLEQSYDTKVKEVTYLIGRLIGEGYSADQLHADMLAALKDTEAEGE